MDESTASEAPAPEPGPAAEAADECTNCLGARAVVLALAFAAFAAWCAADFATGGRLTAAVLGAVAAVRGRGSEEQ
jgi:hypothetical protein